MKKSAYLLPRIIWIALTASQVMYALVLYQTVRISPAAPVENPLPWMPFAMAATVFGACSILLFGRFTSDDAQIRVIRAIRQSGEPGDADSVRYRVVHALFKPMIITWALNEAICLLGFIPSFLARDLSIFYPFVGAAVGLNLIMMPRFRGAEREVTQFKLAP